MTLDMYSDKVAEASALIREFAKVDYFHYFARDPESSLEEFIAMLDQAEEKGRQSQAARIAELEALYQEAFSNNRAAQQRIYALEHAAPSAPAVEQQPIGYISNILLTERRKTFERDGAVMYSQPAGMYTTPVFAAPQAADTDKVREAVEAMNRAKLLPIWDNDVPHKLHVELDVIFKALSSMAAQAPVREVPGWISVKDRLPAQGVPVFVYTPANKYSDERIDFDCIDPEDDTASTWDQHNQHYEHWCCVAKPEGSIDPSAEAPYTHWMPLPAAPVQQEGGRG